MAVCLGGLRWKDSGIKPEAERNRGIERETERDRERKKREGGQLVNLTMSP